MSNSLPPADNAKTTATGTRGVSSNDEPTLHDALGRADFVRRMAEVIKTCKPPKVFGLHGDWGAGKTSALHQLFRELAGACPHSLEEEPNRKLNRESCTEVVWFEAWRYEQETMPVVALLQEIRTHFSMKQQLLDWTGKIAKVTMRSFLDIDFVVGKMIGVSADKIEKHGENVERDRFQLPIPTQLLRQQLDEAISDLLKGTKKKENRRLVVIIDDLDRCSPNSAYKLLEGIKIYLNLKSCVFVLGMNQRVIEQAIAETLKHDMTAVEDKQKPHFSQFRAREYLEKICQDLWHLPVLKDPHEYLADCLEGVPWAKTIGAIAKTSQCLPPNPRKIKTLGNVLRRYEPQLSAEKIDHNVAQKPHYQALVVACLYCFHPEIYRRVELYPDFLVEVVNWSNHLGSSDHELFRGLVLPQRKPDASTASDAATPGSEPSLPTFPDPTRTNAFLLGKLLKGIGLEGIDQFLLR